MEVLHPASLHLVWQVTPPRKKLVLNWCLFFAMLSVSCSMILPFCVLICFPDSNKTIIVLLKTVNKVLRLCLLYFWSDCDCIVDCGSFFSKFIEV